MELETIVKAIFIGLVLLLHLPDHPKSRFFIAKMKVVWDHTKILCPYPNQGYIPALDPLHSMKTILAIHTYPGKFYIQKTRAISDFSSQVY